MSSIITMNALTMSSREIADLVESRHDDVKRSIERLANRGVIVQPPLADEPGIDAMGRTRITQVYSFSGEQGKRDSIIVVAQLSPEFTARLVDRWQELENQIARRDPMEVLNDPSAMRGLLLTYSEKVLELQDKVEEQAPKVEAHDRIADSTGTLCLRDAAKALQMQPLKLNQWMNANGWIYRRPGKGSWIAYQDRIQSGHLTHKLTPYIDQNTGDNKVSEQVRVTGKGLTLLAKRLNVEVDGTPGMIPPPPAGAPAHQAVY